MEPVSTPETLVAENEAMLEELAELKGQMAEAAKMKKRYDELRDRVQYNLQVLGSDKTKPHAGVYVTIAHKSDLVIDDQAGVENWLADNVIDPMDYYKLNPAAIRELAAERMAEDGELIPGLRVIETETASVREAKK